MCFWLVLASSDRSQSGPSLAKAQARDPRHEIELRDRGVADPDRVQADPALADDDVVALGALCDRVMHRDLEPDLVDTRFERRDTLTAVEPRHVRHECLDHEDAVGGQMPRHRLETHDLSVLGRQREECVEHDVGERESRLELEVTEVRDGRRDARSALLGSEPGQHGLRRVDPVDLDALAMQRHGHTSGSDAELERGAGGRELPQERDRCVDIARA